MARPKKYKTEAERLAAQRSYGSARSRLFRSLHPEDRRFVAYDGEGIGTKYILLANDEEHIYNPKGLGTKRMLDFLFKALPGHPVRVWFAFNYDMAHIFKSLPDLKIKGLYACSEVEYMGYTLQYIPRKIFTIKKGGRKITHYDAWGFFQSSFVSACKKFLGAVPDIITEGKIARSDFSLWPKERIIAYNASECKALVEIMTKLRALLVEPMEGIPPLEPRGWHGPGAIAAKVLRHLEVDRHVAPEKYYEPYMIDRFSRAYFGGRIESLGVGTLNQPVYKYDIRSAYPHAMRSLPRLSFKWKELSGYDPTEQFAIYHVKWDLKPYMKFHDLPGPFPHRDKTGYITYRAEGEGWYWKPEIDAALKHYPGIEVLGGMSMAGPYTYPLARTVDRMYDLRASLKSVGDAREYPLKLALNSLYGKLAQKEGSARYRSIAWAGWITSTCRAMALDAMWLNPNAIIATMTDGLVTTSPLPLPVGTQLGQWEEEQYSGLTILQPGIYSLGHLDDPHRIERWRGYNVRAFDWPKVVADINSVGETHIACPMFIGHPLALNAPNAYGPHRLDFMTITRRLAPFVSHKRHIYTGDFRAGEGGGSVGDTYYCSRLIMLPPGQEPTISEPYSAFAPTVLETLERNALDSAIEDNFGID